MKKYTPLLLIFLAIFFSYSGTCEFIGQFIQIPYIKTSYLWLISLLFSLYLGFRFLHVAVFQKITKVMILVITLVPLSEVVYNIVFHSDRNILEKNLQTISLTNQNNQIHFNKKPNVYFIMTDAYGSQNTLLKTAGFDNSPFISKMREKGFFVGENAVSNYHFTTASLSATMNMKLHVPAKSNNRVLSFSSMYPSLKGNNIVRRVFKRNGYKIINFPAHWHEITCYGYEDQCIKSKSFDVPKAFLSTTPLSIFNAYIPNHYVDISNIANAIDLFPDDPKFIFAHLAQIHDAIYDEKGRKVRIHNPMYSNREEAKGYIDSIKETNRQLIDFVNIVMKKDPTAIIIIMADHGPSYVGNQPKKMDTMSDDIRVHKPEDYGYLFGIFSAVYIPGVEPESGIAQYFSNSPTPVNLFNYIFSYLSGTLPQLENDTSFLLHLSNKDNGYNYIKIKN